MIDLANYTAETWPDKEQADAARMNLSQIYLGMGRVRRGDQGLERGPHAVAAMDPAQNRLGLVHWREEPRA